MNLHPQKLYALVGGGLGLLGMILPWVSVSSPFGGMGGGGGGNGFGGWGILSLIGVVGVAITSLMNDKSKPYDSNFKMGAIGSFAAIALGAFIVFMQLNGQGNGLLSVKPGIGIWITILAGVLGALFVAGIIKVPPPKGPTPPPPPTPPQ